MLEIKHVLHQEVPIRSNLIVIGSTWSAEDLAREATLGLATIRRAEGAENETSMTLANDLAVRRALESAGVEFLDENGGGPGCGTKAAPEEELRLHHRREQRFRSALGVDQKRQAQSLATWTERRIFIRMAARLPDNFQCPECRTEYRVVRIRKPPEPHDRPAFCVCCTRPLQPRDGDFFLKYVKVKPPGNWAIEARLMAVFMTSGA
jgi:hypothetical protein